MHRPLHLNHIQSRLPRKPLNNMAPSTIHPFSKLPTELRLKIWGYSIDAYPFRYLEIEGARGGGCSAATYDIKSKDVAPAGFLVNHEAREVIMKTYEKVYGTEDYFLPGRGEGLRAVYCDFSRDVFVLTRASPTPALSIPDRFFQHHENIMSHQHAICEFGLLYGDKVTRIAVCASFLGDPAELVSWGFHRRTRTRKCRTDIMKHYFGDYQYLEEIHVVTDLRRNSWFGGEPNNHITGIYGGMRREWKGLPCPKDLINVKSRGRRPRRVFSRRSVKDLVETYFEEELDIRLITNHPRPRENYPKVTYGVLMAKWWDWTCDELSSLLSSKG